MLINVFGTLLLLLGNEFFNVDCEIFDGNKSNEYLRLMFAGGCFRAGR